MLAKLTYAVGKTREVASPRDWFLAVAFATRDIIVGRWLESLNGVYDDGRKRVYYLSLEFLIGRLLFDAMTNLGVAQLMAEALDELGVNLYGVAPTSSPTRRARQRGLGALAACFMDSMATLSIAAHGYGIRYDNGLFRQIIRSGWQQETPEDWLVNGNPWEFVRPEYNYAIGFGGWVEHGPGAKTTEPGHVWHPAETVEAVAYDTPIVGWRGRHVDHTLRLWSAWATRTRRARRLQRGRLHRRLRRCAPRRSPRFPIQAMRRRPARSCVSGRSISSPPPRFLTSFAATSNSTATYGRRRTFRRPAERHLSGDRHRRTNAHPGRPQ